MTYFALIILAVIVTSAFAFMLLEPSNGTQSLDAVPNEFSTWGRSMFTTFGQMLIGTYEPTSYWQGFLLPFSFMVTELIVHVVLLNALIAIMSDTYDRVCETQRERGLLNRAHYLLEQMRLMTKKQLDDVRYFPRWLHLLARVENEDGHPNPVAQSGGWGGKVTAVKSEVAKAEESISSKVVIADLSLPCAAESRAHSHPHVSTFLRQQACTAHSANMQPPTARSQRSPLLLSLISQMDEGLERLTWRVNEILAFQQEELTTTKGPTAVEQRAAVVEEMRLQRVAMERLARVQETLSRASSPAAAPAPAQAGLSWLWISPGQSPRNQDNNAQRSRKGHELADSQLMA